MRGSIPLVYRLLGSKAAVWLGAISYSLYLTHYPLLPIIHQGLRALPLGPVARFVLLSCLAPALALLVAFGFHLIFERPFMSGRRDEERPRPVEALAMQTA